MKIIHFEMKSNIIINNNISHYINYNIIAEDENVYQKSYRLKVFRKDMKWDSGIIKTVYTQNLLCKNLKLKGYTQYQYILCVETNKGIIETNGYFSTGILNYKINSNWIFSNKESEEVIFSKKFNVPCFENSDASIVICTTRLYNLYINDIKINKGITLSYTFSDKEIYAQEYSFKLLKKSNEIVVVVRGMIIKNPGFTMQIRIKEGNNKIRYILTDETWSGFSFTDNHLINSQIYIYNENYLLKDEEFNPKLIVYNKELIYDSKRIIFGKIKIDEDLKNKTIICSEEKDFKNYSVINVKNSLELYKFRYLKIIDESVLGNNKVFVVNYKYLELNKCNVIYKDIRLENILCNYYEKYKLGFMFDLYNRDINNIYDYIIINNNILLKTYKGDCALYGYCKYQRNPFIIDFYFSIYYYRKSYCNYKINRNILKEILENNKLSIDNVAAEEIYKYIIYLKKYQFFIYQDCNKRLINKYKSLVKKYNNFLINKYLRKNIYKIKDINFIYAYIINEETNNKILNDLLFIIINDYQNVKNCSDELFSKIIYLLIKNKNISLAFDYIYKRIQEVNKLNPYLFTDILNAIFSVSFRYINDQMFFLIDILDDDINYLSCNFTIGNSEVSYVSEKVNNNYDIELDLPVCYFSAIKLPYGKISYIGSGFKKIINKKE